MGQGDANSAGYGFEALFIAKMSTSSKAIVNGQATGRVVEIAGGRRFSSGDLHLGLYVWVSVIVAVGVSTTVWVMSVTRV